MAGKPMRRKTAEIVAEIGGIDRIFEMMAQGRSLTSIAKEIDVHVMSLSELCRKPELMERYVAAKQASADAFVQKGLEAVEEAAPQDAQVAKLKWDAYRFMAARLAPDEWDDKKQPMVNINIGDLHLEALKKRPITIDVQNVERTDD